ncbi:hypothetical protein BC567DRAFT_218341 [Phyllosticta citribraziliensis]
MPQQSKRVDEMNKILRGAFVHVNQTALNCVYKRLLSYSYNAYSASCIYIAQQPLVSAVSTHFRLDGRRNRPWLRQHVDTNYEFLIWLARCWQNGRHGRSGRRRAVRGRLRLPYDDPGNIVFPAVVHHQPSTFLCLLFRLRLPLMFVGISKYSFPA